MDKQDRKELNRLRARREWMKQKLEDSCNRRKAAKESGDEKAIGRERIRAAYLTTFITRLNDDIFALERALGADPEELGASDPAQ